MHRRRRLVLFSPLQPSTSIQCTVSIHSIIHVKHRDWGLHQSWLVCYMTNAFRWGVRDLGHIYVCVCVHRTVWVRFFFYCFTIKTDISRSKYRALFQNAYTKCNYGKYNIIIIYNVNLLFSLIIHVVNRRMFAIKCVAENSVECIFVKQMFVKKTK